MEFEKLKKIIAEVLNVDEEEITMYMINPKAPCFIRNMTAVPTAIICANAALAGCETLLGLDKMSETVLRVGLKLKEYGINDLGVCYCKVQRDAAIATKRESR